MFGFKILFESIWINFVPLCFVNNKVILSYFADHTSSPATTVLSALCCSCVHGSVVEGSWVTSAGWCAWRASYFVDGCIVVATECGRYSLSCTQKLWSKWAVLGLHDMLESQLRVPPLYMCLFSFRKLYCDLFLFRNANSWQNSTRCRGGVKVLWCHSHLVWLGFVGSIRELFCDLFMIFGIM